MNFSEALEVMKQGGMVTRGGWNVEHKFVFMQVPATIDKEIVPKMQSLPQSVKRHFQTTFDNPNEQISAIYYSNQFALVGRSNMITGWSPSPTDILTGDWYQVDAQLNNITH